MITSMSRRRVYLPTEMKVRLNVEAGSHTLDHCSCWIAPTSRSYSLLSVHVPMLFNHHGRKHTPTLPGIIYCGNVLSTRRTIYETSTHNDHSSFTLDHVTVFTILQNIRAQHNLLRHIISMDPSNLSTIHTCLTNIAEQRNTGGQSCITARFDQPRYTMARQLAMAAGPHSAGRFHCLLSYTGSIGTILLGMVWEIYVAQCFAQNCMINVRAHARCITLLFIYTPTSTVAQCRW